MAMRSTHLFAGLILIVLAAAAGYAQSGVRDVNFTVSMPQPHTHLFEVQIRIRHEANYSPKQETLLRPMWTPGSYLIREFERQVQDFNATDAAGSPLAWEKINKNSWRV